MDLNYKAPTDSEMRTIVSRAHNLRAEAIREMGQAFGAFVKSRFAAVKNLLIRPAHKAA